MELLELDRAAAFLDLGCGNGAFALAAARAYPECQIHACDLLESATAECAKSLRINDLRNLHVFRARATAVPLKSCSADRILVRNVLHHIEKPDATVG